jgi:hypothetical protein
MRQCTNIVRMISSVSAGDASDTGKSLKDGAFTGAGKLSA